MFRDGFFFPLRGLVDDVVAGVLEDSASCCDAAVSPAAAMGDFATSCEVACWTTSAPDGSAPSSDPPGNAPDGPQNSLSDADPRCGIVSSPNIPIVTI